MTEDQYHQICDACDEVLHIQDNSLARVAIPWLHVIREHPIILEKYNGLFIKEKWFPAVLRNFRTFVFRQAIWYRQILRAIKCNGQLWFGSDVLPEKVDYLFISYLLNPKQYSQKEDFYFGSIPAELTDKKRSVAVAAISHFSGHHAFFKSNFVTGKVPRLFFSDSLNLVSECEIRNLVKNESRNLKKLGKKEDRNVFKKIFFKASEEALSGETHGNLRLGVQIQGLIKRLQPKAIVIPYEGHAFERIVFASARVVNPLIKCISYQHTGVFRLSNAIRRALLPQYNPDIILTSGTEGKLELEKIEAFKNLKINVLGSDRGIINTSDIVEAENKPSAYRCLVIPEGFESECMILFRYSLLCAQQNSDITFIWRLHPGITFTQLSANNPEFSKLPDNIILSANTIEMDIVSCNWVLYRGTTAVYKAISKGLRPIYLRNGNEMTIDPLYEMQKWRVVVDSPSDLLSCVASDIKNNMFDNKSHIGMATEICQKRYNKIDIDVINAVIP